MSVFRINKTRDFTIMSNSHFKEKKMSLKAKGLLSLMLSLPDDWQYNLKGLVTLSKDGKDSVMAGLAELEEFGYLRRERTKDDSGKFSGIIYHIYETPQKENPISDFPNPDMPNDENPNSGEPHLLSTKDIKNLSNQELNEFEREEKPPEEEIYDILEGIQDKELRELYTDYVIQRRENRSQLTPKGLHMLIARGYRLSDNDISIHRAIVETAIINNWMNLYEPKAEEKIGRNGYLEERKRYYLGD